MKVLVEELSRFGVEVVLVSAAEPSSVRRLLGAHPAGPGGLQVIDDDGDRPALELALDLFATRGLGPGLVLAVAAGFRDDVHRVPDGDDVLRRPRPGSRAVLVSVGPTSDPGHDDVLPKGGGPATTRRLLAAQVEAHRAGVVPDIDEDPRWIVDIRTPPTPRRVAQALTTLADGFVGTRGSLEGEGAAAGASVLLAGCYVGEGSAQRLLEAPLWTVVGPSEPSGEVTADQMLDMRTGVLLRRGPTGSHVESSLRFASAELPGVVAMRAQGWSVPQADGPLRLPEAPGQGSQVAENGSWARVEGRGRAVTVAAWQRRHTATGRLERLAAYSIDADEPRERLAQARGRGFDALLAEQRAAWAERWARAQPDLPDDPAAELALRFALFQLIGSAATQGEAAVGARGLSGPGYSGHVFWDADVFVLPVLAATRPAAARAMLEYRLRRLGAARQEAARQGCRGARFPWESAASGFDVTPTSAVLGDQVADVRTGELEVHVVADVAWAAWRYAEWTGDRAFLAGPGRPLVVETARYWASRARWDGGGRAHIDGVIGPDEYHVDVDDDAFTNVMARWNLQRAADLVAAEGTPAEQAESRDWRSLASAIVDGYDPVARLHRQFAGFERLEPLIVGEVAEPPVAADLLLGTERVARAQVLKQADVLMLHHLVPGEVEPESLVSDLAYYGPRTAHGSSLSPAIHAALLARAGRPEEALHWFRLAAGIDLDDLSEMGGSGLHLAALGGLWQAFAQGFLGIVPTFEGLRFDPRLPDAWPRAGLRLVFNGSLVHVSVDREMARVSADRAVHLLLADGTSTTTRQAVLTRGDAGWVLAGDRAADMLAAGSRT